MKPVWIFVHHPVEGPGLLAEFFVERSIPYQLIPIWDRAIVPENLAAASALVFMGGPMSVHDPLPWIAPELNLIQRAHAQGIPILGHCLGAQLITLALGGEVFTGNAKEIGWLPITIKTNASAQRFFGDTKDLDVFHWHGEQCTLPTNAIPLASSPITPHQSFVHGHTLALQFHLEVTHDMVEEWCHAHAAELSDALKQEQHQNSVQSVALMLQRSEAAVCELRDIAWKVYSAWIESI